MRHVCSARRADPPPVCACAPKCRSHKGAGHYPANPSTPSVSAARAFIPPTPSKSSARESRNSLLRPPLPSFFRRVTLVSPPERSTSRLAERTVAQGHLTRNRRMDMRQPCAPPLTASEIMAASTPARSSARAAASRESQADDTICTSSCAKSALCRPGATVVIVSSRSAMMAPGNGIR